MGQCRSALQRLSHYHRKSYSHGWEGKLFTVYEYNWIKARRFNFKFTHSGSIWILVLVAMNPFGISAASPHVCSQLPPRVSHLAVNFLIKLQLWKIFENIFAISKHLSKGVHIHAAIRKWVLQDDKSLFSKETEKQ